MHPLTFRLLDKKHFSRSHHQSGTIQRVYLLQLTTAFPRGCGQRHVPPPADSYLTDKRGLQTGAHQTPLLHPSLCRATTTADIMRIFAVLALLTTANAIYFTDCLQSANSAQKWTPTKVLAQYSPESAEMRFAVQGTLAGPPLTDLNAAENKYTTLSIDAATYSHVFLDNYTRFCNSAEGGCPFGPGKTSFSYSYYLPHSLGVTDILSQFKIVSPVENGGGLIVGCVAVQTTPVLSKGVTYPIIFGTLGVAIVFFVAAFAQRTFSSWSRLSSGGDALEVNPRDEQLWAFKFAEFRSLVSYAQFAFFAACLRLGYPGIYQGLASGLGWSTLTFGKSFTAKVLESEPEDPALNLYNIQRPGISAMATIVGLNDDRDIWPGFIVWFLVIFGASLIPTVATRLSSRSRRASLPAGLARTATSVVFQLLALPLLSYCFYQLQAGHTLVVAKVFSGIIVGVWALGAAGFVWSIARGHETAANRILTGCFAKTKTSSSSSSFNAAMISVDLGHVFLQALAIGVLQASGVAQISFLAALEFLYCAVKLILRPFEPSSHLNIVTSVLSLWRFCLVLLSIVFVPSLNVARGPRIWIAYVILVGHAVVFVLFFVRAVLVGLEARFYRNLGADAATTTASAPAAFGYNHEKSSPRDTATLLGNYQSNDQEQPTQFIHDLEDSGKGSYGHEDTAKGLINPSEQREDTREEIRADIRADMRAGFRDDIRPSRSNHSRGRSNSDLYERRMSAVSNCASIGRKSLTIDTSFSKQNGAPDLSPVAKTKTIERQITTQTYYRPPRRRSEDHAGGGATPITPSADIPVLPSPNVDYTQREADIYKRSSTMCDDFDRESLMSCVETWPSSGAANGVAGAVGGSPSTAQLLTKTRSGEKSVNRLSAASADRSGDKLTAGLVPTSPKHLSRLFQPKTWLKKEEDPLAPKGFEVIGRDVRKR